MILGTPYAAGLTPGPLDSSGASRLLDDLDGGKLAPDAQELARERLREYKERRMSEGKPYFDSAGPDDATVSHYNKAFEVGIPGLAGFYAQTPEGKASWDATQESLKFAVNPDEAIADSLLMGFATDVHGVSPDSINAATWKFQRDNIARAYGGNGGESASQVFGLVRAHGKKQKIERDAYEQIYRAGADAAIKGEPWHQSAMTVIAPLMYDQKMIGQDAETLQKTQDAYRQSYERAKGFEKRMGKDLRELTGWLDWISSIDKNAEGNILGQIQGEFKATEPLKLIREKVMKLESVADMEFAADYVAAKSKEKIEEIRRSQGDEIASEVTRMIAGQFTGAMQGLENLQRTYLQRSGDVWIPASIEPDDLLAYFSDRKRVVNSTDAALTHEPGTEKFDMLIHKQWRKLDKSERAALQNELERMQKGEEWGKGVVDRINGEARSLKWLYSDEGTLPRMVTHAGVSVAEFAISAPAAMTFFAISSTEEKVARMDRIAPDLGADEALAIVAAESAGEALIERWQQFGFAGKTPILTATLNKLGMPIRNRWARFGVGLAGSTIGESMEETLQQFTPNIVEGLYNQFADQPKIANTLKEDLAEFGESAPEMVMTMGIMSLLGQGISTVRNWRADGDAMAMLRSPLHLQAAGVDAPDIEAITAAKSHEEAIRLYQGAKRDIRSEGAREAQAELETLFRQGMKAAAAGTVVTKTLRGTYRVTMPDGKVAEVANVRDAWQLASELTPKAAREGLSEEEKNVWKQAEAIAMSEPLLQKMEAGEELTADEKAKLKEWTSRVDGNEDAESLVISALKLSGVKVAGAMSAGQIRDAETEIAGLEAELAKIKADPIFKDPAPPVVHPDILKIENEIANLTEGRGNNRLSKDEEAELQALQAELNAVKKRIGPHRKGKHPVKRKGIEKAKDARAKLESKAASINERIASLRGDIEGSKTTSRRVSTIPTKEMPSSEIRDAMFSAGWDYVQGYGFVFGAVEGDTAVERRKAIASGKTDGRTPDRLDWVRASMALLGQDTDVWQAPALASRSAKAKEAFKLKSDTLGIVPNTKGMKAVNKIFQAFRKYGTARGHLPSVAFEAKLRASNQFARIMLQARQNLNALEAAIKSLELQGNPAEIDAQRQGFYGQVNEYMVGDRAIEDLPDALRAPAMAMRSHIDRASVMLIQEDVIAGDVVQIIEGNLGTYLNRSYRIFDDPEWTDNIPPEVRNRVKGLLRRQLPQRPAETDAQYNDRLEGAINALLNVQDRQSPIGAIQGLDSIGYQNLIARQEIPPEIRALWGEYTLAHENYAKTIMKMAQQLTAHRYLAEVRQLGMGVFLFEEATGEFASQIGGDVNHGAAYLPQNPQNRAKGPLHELYTSREILQAITPMATGELSPWMSVWNKVAGINALVKYGKTVLAPIAHTRNFVSNLLATVRNGNLNGLIHSGQAIKSLWVDILPATWTRGGWGRDAEADLQRYVELGVAKSASLDELRAIIDSTITGNITMDEWIEGKIGKRMAVANQTLQKMYAAGDSFWRIVNFEGERAKLARIYRDDTPAELDARAMAIVERTMANYDRIPKAIREWEKFPLFGSFTSFQSEVIRTEMGFWAQVREELADPQRRKIGIARLGGALIAHSAPFVTVGFAALINGVSEEEDKDIRAHAPPWDANGILLYYGRNKDGHLQYINLSYCDPFSLYKKPIMALMRGDVSEERAVGMAIQEFLSPYLSKDIATEAIFDVFGNNKSKTGKEIWKETDSIERKVELGWKHFYSTAAPGALTTATRIAMAATGTETVTGRSYDLFAESIAPVTGQRIVSIDPDQSMQFKVGEFTGARANASSYFRDIATRNGTVTDKELQEAWESSQKAYDDAYKTFSFQVQSAVRLGVTPSRIAELCKERIDRGLVNSALAGKESPYTASRDFMKSLSKERREQIARAIPEFKVARSK